MPGPLEGFKVIDVCRAGPGWMATGILADYGADCISIVEAGYSERRGAMDALQRNLGSRNRKNKRSIFLNLRAEGAQKVFLNLAERSDAILESNRPGVAKRLGIDYETVLKVNPNIVYCSLSGFGQTGPYSNIANHDLSCQGVAGTIPLDDQGKPMVPTHIWADLSASYFGAISLLMGLVKKQKTGKGDYIDVSFTDVCVTLQPGRLRDEMPGGAYPCYNIYETKDSRYITLSIREPWFWERMCKLFGREDWIPHIRPQGEMRQEMFRVFRQKFLEKNMDEWFKILTEHDIQFGVVNTSIEQLRQDPHIQSREMILKLEDPFTGEPVYELGFPMKFKQSPATLRRGPSKMGGDTLEVLREIGYSHGEFARLRDEGVIA